jgi:hypothetical protein
MTIVATLGFCGRKYELPVRLHLWLQLLDEHFGDLWVSFFITDSFIRYLENYLL